MRLFIGNISSCTSKKSFIAEFEKFGRCEIEFYRRFAYVDYLKDSDAKNALNSWNNQEMNGSRLKVEFSQLRPPGYSSPSSAEAASPEQRHEEVPKTEMLSLNVPEVPLRTPPNTPNEGLVLNLEIKEEVFAKGSGKGRAMQDIAESEKIDFKENEKNVSKEMVLIESSGEEEGGIKEETMKKSERFHESGLEYGSKEIEVEMIFEDDEEGMELDERKEDMELDERKEDMELDERKGGLELDERKGGLDLDERKCGLDLDERKEGMDLDERKEGIDLDMQKNSEEDRVCVEESSEKIEGYIRHNENLAESRAGIDKGEIPISVLTDSREIGDEKEADFDMQKTEKIEKEVELEIKKAEIIEKETYLDVQRSENNEKITDLEVQRSEYNEKTADLDLQKAENIEKQAFLELQKTENIEKESDFFVVNSENTEKKSDLDTENNKEKQVNFTPLQIEKELEKNSENIKKTCENQTEKTETFKSELKETTDTFIPYKETEKSATKYCEESKTKSREASPFDKLKYVKFFIPVVDPFVVKIPDAEKEKPSIILEMAKRSSERSDRSRKITTEEMQNSSPLMKNIQKTARRLDIDFSPSPRKENSAKKYKKIDDTPSESKTPSKTPVKSNPGSVSKAKMSPLKGLKFDCRLVDEETVMISQTAFKIKKKLRDFSSSKVVCSKCGKQLKLKSANTHLNTKFHREFS